MNYDINGRLLSGIEIDSRTTSRKVERAMGIEPTGKALPELENKRFGATVNAKCD
jgi:hypothetical protein